MPFLLTCRGRPVRLSTAAVGSSLLLLLAIPPPLCISQAACAQEMVHLTLQGRWKAAQLNQAALRWQQGRAALLSPHSPGLCQPLPRLWDRLARSIL